MIRAFALAALIVAPAAAQETTPPAPVAPAPAIAPAAAPAATPRPGTVRVVLRTAAGPIVLALERQRAPITTANFLRYLDARRFDGITFYRAFRFGEGTEAGLIQAGMRNPRLAYPPIAHEPTSKTGLSHTDGTISMARAAPGSAIADFFIVVGDQTGFDAGPNGDGLGYAAFGRVVEGMDVVRRILAAPTSPTLGGAAMRGQMIVAPIRIATARRLP